MTPEQKQIILDCAQEMQHNETWWKQFEFRYREDDWEICNESANPLARVNHRYYEFRRRPRTITVTIPRINNGWALGVERLTLHFTTEADRDTALAAIRSEMEKVK